MKMTNSKVPANLKGLDTLPAKTLNTLRTILLDMIERLDNISYEIDAIKKEISESQKK